MGSTRDYYADLELPSTADVQEIKKQFRKLALKYHPDRNPGREQEVNAQFQVIQAANEVLSDPEQKAKYDASRARSRYPTASGVRGNPWANAGDQFPPPPRRGQPTRPAPSGAQRWQTRFSQGVPPTAKQNYGPNPEVKQNAARAFENMRKPQTSTRPAEQPRPNPPPPPPRSETAKQRAEASFGTRKTGYYPRSATHGDEPPVSSSNYNTSYNTRPVPEPPVQNNPEPKPMPDPLRQFREQANTSGSRHGNQYTSNTGERTHPYDGVPLGRTRSGRQTSRGDSSSPDADTPPRQHSFNVRKESKVEDMSSEMNAQTMEQNPPPKIPLDTRPKAPLKKTRTGQRYTSGINDSGTQPPPASAAEFTPTKPPKDTNGGPSMYATPCNHIRHSSMSISSCGICRAYNSPALRSTKSKCHQDDGVPLCDLDKTAACNPSPSGDQDSSLQLTAFEVHQQELLARLIQNAENSASARMREKTRRQRMPKQPASMNRANTNFSISFSFPVDDETFATASPEAPPLSRTSTEDINTRFGNDHEADAWQFSAGGSEQGTPTRPRPPPGSRFDRRSPLKRPTMPHSDTSSVPSDSGNPEPGFNAEGWTKEFGPHTFVPAPPQPKPASPSRSMRGNSKKGRPAKTPGKTSVEIDSGSEEEVTWPGRRAQQAGPAAADSPQAMDIDSPPAKTTTPPTTSVPGSADQTEPTNGARNINVEPTRPEWRPGNAEAVNGEAAPVVPPKVPFNPNTVGSEDSEEFLANFAELKNVAPFAKQDSTGLKSMADLKDNLPFESKPSPEGPVKISKPQPLEFPTPPIAPTLPMVAVNGRKPHIAAWEKYVKDFESYLQDWDAFNSKVVNHFSTRKGHIETSRKAKGYSFLEAQSDLDIQEYFNWVQQDHDVRKKWSDACDVHEQKFRDFMAFRMKMKS
ncbi:hypothetical protein BGZ63DRAFT_190518 [Mariannaea sp. PMI_226]|nr:hypothetical protein BGZ63DRAFT_190518 [Mariannaea sp. PMI_226]